MGSKRVVVVGSSFAGLTAAVELKKKLKNKADVVVVSKTDSFVFMPSLIWVPFGLRNREDVSFPVRPVFEKFGIDFRKETVTGLELEKNTVVTDQGELSYDYLVLATGPKLNYAAVKGLGPDAHTQSIFSPDAAEQAAVAWKKFLENPGPVVIGAVQGASCFGAAYEFLFNFAHQLKQHSLHEKVKLTYLTAEPFLAHFGIGGFGKGTEMTEYFFKKLGIEAITSAQVKEIQQEAIHLEDGRTLPFKYAMLAPAFQGVDPVRAREDIIATPAGFVKVKETYQTEKYPNVYAAGVAVHMDPPDKTPVPCGVPKTGYLSEEMAKVVAHNIAAELEGGKLIGLPPAFIDAKCVLDAGDTGIIMSGDHFLEPREHAWLVPGPEAHWAKLAFEKYFITTRKHGWV
jgi:sulfide:quinone oxidoreductase